MGSYGEAERASDADGATREQRWGDVQALRPHAARRARPVARPRRRRRRLARREGALLAARGAAAGAGGAEGLARLPPRSEAVASSRIEGLSAGAGRPARAELESREPGSVRHDRAAAQALGNIHATPPVSLALATDRRTCLSALAGVQGWTEPEEGRAAVGAWLPVFAGAVLPRAAAGRRWRPRWPGWRPAGRRPSAAPRRGPALALLIPEAQAMPYLTVGTVARATGRSYAAVNAAVARLVEAGVAVETTKGKRSRVFLVPDVVEELDRVERGLASPARGTRAAPPAARGCEGAGPASKTGAPRGAPEEKGKRDMRLVSIGRARAAERPGPAAQAGPRGLSMAGDGELRAAVRAAAGRAPGFGHVETPRQAAEAVGRAAALFPVSAAALFGSFARGEQGPGSDADALAALAPGPGLGDAEAFREALEYACGRPAGLLTSLEGAAAAFRESVMRDGVRVYG